MSDGPDTQEREQVDVDPAETGVDVQPVQTGALPSSTPCRGAGQLDMGEVE